MNKISGAAKTIISISDDVEAWLAECFLTIIENKHKTVVNMNEFMETAYREALNGICKKHGGPFGAVIVKDNVIIAKGHNEVLLRKDPTAHAEVVAIRKACKKLNTVDLSGCVLYVTSKPCPMCKGAIQWSRIKDVVFSGDYA